MSTNNDLVAFAMGGLAGNNAHGAGFLQAALDHDVEPCMISCTSGQILWVYRYLQGLTDDPSTDLLEMLRDDIRQINPLDDRNVAWLGLVLFGKTGVFAPAWGEIINDWMENLWRCGRRLFTSPAKRFLVQEWAELFPCRYLVPDFPASFYEKIAGTFRGASIGIIFNSYNPRSGHEYVYLNDTARERLHQRSDRREDEYAPGSSRGDWDRTTYKDIDAKAVRDALWLYQYGFKGKENGFVDGAYFRELILSELTVADKIFCVRPINHRWIGHMPRNYIEIEDLKTEIGFDGAYCAERHRIEMVNNLFNSESLPDEVKSYFKKRYHEVDLVELEIDKPRGYFDYVFESEDVFTAAYDKAKKHFGTD